MNESRDPHVMMIEGLMSRMSEERKASATNMRLGEFISALEKCDASLPVILDSGRSLDCFESYRGYYEDLSITPSEQPISVGEVLTRARAAVGECFEGYKGGEFWMTKNSILWVAPYGSCGSKLVSVTPEADRVVIGTQADD